MTCTACEAKDKEIGWLRGRLEALQDQVLALANPAALAVARGQVPAVQQPLMTPEGAADVVDNQGQGYIMVEGKLVPLTEWHRAQGKLQEMMAGG